MSYGFWAVCGSTRLYGIYHNGRLWLGNRPILDTVGRGEIGLGTDHDEADPISIMLELQEARTT